MSRVYDIYNGIDKFKDLESILSSINDGESSIIEFKSVCENLNSKINKAKLKAKIAKEVCAFANSGGGILVLGVEYKDETLHVKNVAQHCLEQFLDGNLHGLIDPDLSGVEMKTILDDQGDTCTVFFIPKSNILPHRVGSWSLDDARLCKYLGQYFGRIGSNSIPLSENIIRAMYLSGGRVPRVSIQTELNKIGFNIVRLSVIVMPDPSIYISDYYNENSVFLLNNDYSPIYNEDRLAYRCIDGCAVVNPPIYPTEQPYVLFSRNVQYKDKDDLYLLTDTDGNIELTEDENRNARIMILRSRFACNNVPLIEKKNMYIFKDSSILDSRPRQIREVNIDGLDPDSRVFVVFAASGSRNSDHMTGLDQEAITHIKKMAEQSIE